MENIAELLRKAREEAGIELKEVSKDLGIEEVVLNNIENGKIGAFKDIFSLKDNLANYAKYLGLNQNQIIDEFNEYLFEYTSKIPIEEIEKTMELQNTNNSKEISSPYTSSDKDNKKIMFLIICILIFLLIVMIMILVMSKINLSNNNVFVIGYRK